MAERPNAEADRNRPWLSRHGRPHRGRQDLAGASAKPIGAQGEELLSPLGQGKTNALLCAGGQADPLGAYCRDVMMRASSQTREGTRAEIRLPFLTELLWWRPVQDRRRCFKDAPVQRACGVEEVRRSLGVSSAMVYAKTIPPLLVAAIRRGVRLPNGYSLATTQYCNGSRYAESRVIT